MSSHESLPSPDALPSEAGHEANTNVRAQQPPSATTQHRSARVFQLLQNTDDDSYQVRAWIAGQAADVPKGFAERGRYPSVAALTDALSQHVTFEQSVLCQKSDTGDTRRARFGDLSADDWTHYDRFTLS